MPADAIHVYHGRAESIRDAIVRVAPAREVIAWTQRDQLGRGLGEVEILFAAMPPRDGWASAKRLQLIQVLGAGVDMLLPSPDLPERVEVATVRGIFAAEAAEHAVLAMLALTRRLRDFIEKQGARRFEPRAVGSVAGATVAIVGLGEIGRRIARAAAALDMRVVGVCKRPRPVPHVERVLGAEELGGALSVADYVVVALPHTAETSGLIDAAALARMPRGAHLIHLSRGGIVDERALVAALESGHLRGAALDVFTTEPLPPDSPLWSAPNLLVTPHTAGYGERYLERCIEVLIDNVTRLEQSLPRQRLADRALGY